MLGWKSKKMKKLESIESKIDELISGVARSNDESISIQKSRHCEIVSEIDKVSALTTEVKNESVKNLSFITERMDSYEKNILEKLSLSNESSSHQTDIILQRIACLEENHRELLESQKKQVSELRKILDGLEQSQSISNDNIKDIEKTIKKIEDSCYLTQDCIVSSEQLLRMIVMTNVMNEIPEN